MRMPSPHPRPLSSRRSTFLALGAGLCIALGIVWNVVSPWWESQQETATIEQEVKAIRISMEAAGLDLNHATDLLVEVVIQIESQGNPEMVGGVGERGLMQIREGTWREVTERHFGTAIPFDRAFEPDLNRQVGRLYLGDLQVYLYRHQDFWGSDLRSLLLASYNAGPERVRQSGFNVSRLPRSVRSYARRGSDLHDWLLKEDAAQLRELLQPGDRL